MLSRTFFRKCFAIESFFKELCDETTPTGKANALLGLKHNEASDAQTAALHSLKPYSALATSLQAIHGSAEAAGPHRDGVLAGLKLCTNLSLHALQRGEPDVHPTDCVRPIHEILSTSAKTDVLITRCALHALFHQCMQSLRSLHVFLNECGGGPLMHAIAREYAGKIAQAKDKHDETFDPACPDFVIPADYCEIIDYSISVIVLSITRGLYHVEVTDAQKLTALRAALHCLDVLGETATSPALQHKLWEVLTYCCNGSLLVLAETARWFTYQRIGGLANALREAIALPRNTPQALFLQCFFEVHAVLTGERVAMALDAQRANGIAEAILLHGIAKEAITALQKDMLCGETARCSALRFLVNIAASAPEVRSMHGVHVVMGVAEKTADVLVLEQAVQVLWNVLNHRDGLEVFKEMGCARRIRLLIEKKATGDERKAFDGFRRKLDALFGEEKAEIAA